MASGTVPSEPLPAGRTSLPIVQVETAEPDDGVQSPWHGWAALGLPAAADAPEPLEPQGAYGPAAEAPLALPPIEANRPAPPTELLAPAGGLDAAFAAFHYGADAIYLGLKKFSARAEAENFTVEELSEVVAYAHALTPRRRVFVTVNTVVRQDELAELVEALAAC